MGNRNSFQCLTDNLNMKPEELKLSDFQRILIGEIPPFFFIELAFRALIIYLLLIVSMRLMGKRMSAQISRNEMAAVVSLAAAVGIPLMNPDRGLLPPVIITVVIVFFTNYISRRTARDQKFESLTQDDYGALVIDGVLNLPVMEQTRVSRERLFAQLRMLNKTHLGMVKRMYFEANGMFSLVDDPTPKPGLSVLSPIDPDFEARKLHRTDLFVCKNCGRVSDTLISTAQTPCPNCKKIDWGNAVKS
jgi:uncharacterized membrane protein YcaP (DUF421 family)